MKYLPELFELAEEIEEADLLIPRDQYLAAGIHIGTQVKTSDMMPFIYRITRSGLYVIDIRKTDQRIRTAAKMIARYEPLNVLVVAARRYGHRPIKKFCEIVYPEAKLSTIPLWLLSTMSKLSRNKATKGMAQFMKFFENTPDNETADDTDAILGPALTTLKDWAENYKIRLMS